MIRFGFSLIVSAPASVKEVNQEIEALGVKVLSQYATLGQYDFVNIVEGPDNATMLRVSVEMGSRGSIKMLSMPAIPIDDFIATIKK